MSYVPPGLVSLDRARAIFYLICLDVFADDIVRHWGHDRAFWLDFSLENKHAARQRNYASANLFTPVEMLTKDDEEYNFPAAMLIKHPSIIPPKGGKNVTPQANTTNDKWTLNACVCEFPVKFSEMPQEFVLFENLKLDLRPDHALKDMRRLLSEGTISSCVLKSNGDPHWIKKEFWNSEVARDVLMFDTYTQVVSDDGIVVGKVFIKAECLEGDYWLRFGRVEKKFIENDLIVNKDDGTEKTEEENTERQKRGAKPKYDKNLFMWEALKYIFYDTGHVPSSQADHAEETMKRYERIIGKNIFPRKDNGEYKDNRWSREVISDLWVKMDFEPNYKLPVN